MELEACATGDGRINQDGQLEWSLEESPNLANSAQGAAQVKALVTFYISKVPHRFFGSWCEDAAEAYKDTAERVLWYFGKGLQAFATPAPGSAASAAAASAADGPAACVAPNAVPSTAHLAAALPKSPEKMQQQQGLIGNGASNGAGGESQPLDETEQMVKDKTILMQVQNALQKTFAKDTPPGQRVWVWDYDADASDPQVFRATVLVPAWGRRFLGEWKRGKKAAQRSACLVVRDHLDELGAQLQS